MPARGSLTSVVVRWILANVVPQAFLLAACWVYLTVHDKTPAGLIAPGLATLRQPFWFVIAAIYVVISTWLRGAVLRPLVPRFSIPGWIAAAILTSLMVLALTVSGSLIGIAVAKGLALSGHVVEPPPVGLPMPVFMVFLILAAEIMGGILGLIPGLLIGALEAFVVGRSTRNIGTWILWTLAAWSMIFALILLHFILIVLYPRLSPTILTALAASMPILFGLAAALGTLPAVARLARSEGNSG
jgi:hypothetical protein